jgi:hypothetical protein
MLKSERSWGFDSSRKLAQNSPVPHTHGHIVLQNMTDILSDFDQALLRQQVGLLLHAQVAGAERARRRAAFPFRDPLTLHDAGY